MSDIASNLLTVYAIIGNLMAQNYSADIIMLARAIEGEKAAWFGAERDTVGIWIAHTAINRHARPWWGGGHTLEEITKRDFHGTINVFDPSPWAMAIAKDALLSRLSDGHDPTSDCVFMLSLDDIESNGWQEKAQEMVIHKFVSSKGELWFFRDYPGDKSI